MGEAGESEVTDIPEIYTLAGERAGLREINVDDLEDMVRMWEIEKSKGMRLMVDDESDISSTAGELKKWIEEVKKQPYTKFYAVVATKSADPANHGEIEGWFRIDGTLARQSSGEEKERKRYERVTGSTLPDNAPTPVEIAYIRRPGSVSDLMASAIRVAAYKIAADDAETAKRYKPAKKNKLEPRRTIMAFPESTNDKSIAVLERADFNCLKRDVIWKEGQAPTHMYILNWDKFHDTMEKKGNLLWDHLKGILPVRIGKSTIQPITTKVQFNTPKK